MGYDCSRPEKSYKIVGYTYTDHLRIAIYEFATNAWKFIDEGKSKIQQWLCYNSVSLNGNLYWPACDLDRQFFIRILDCSKEILKTFCTVPCKKKASLNTHVLAVFKGDRFSLLEQCDKTREIEIWVTKKKITNGDDGDDVVWIKFMSVSIPNFTWLHKEGTSYFVDNNIYGKSLVVCCRDKTRQACVYIVRGDKCRKIEIDDVVGELRHCSVYVPSLIPIP